jgi:ribosomal protein S18 acetylase RimI-like enzyme
MQTMLWRLMTSSDLPSVSAIADEIHVNFYEDREVFAERQRLYPQGCHVLESEEGIQGYIVSHPWHFKQPPALNTLLKSLPEPAGTYYIHDIVLMPAVRGRGDASQIIKQLIEHARKAAFPNLSLISVNNTAAFWQNHGFRLHEDPALAAKLQTYEKDAQFMVRDL